MKYSKELEHHLHNCTDPHNQYNFDFGHYITVVKNIFWHLDNKLNGQWAQGQQILGKIKFCRYEK